MPPESLLPEFTEIVQRNCGETHSFRMQEQRHFRRISVTVWCLVIFVVVQQVAPGPVPDRDGKSDSVQGAAKSHRRLARMTPLWRIMGTKPQGAYCQNNYECSTGVCRNGHCTFSQPIKS
ncbi:liver-expressed antimicrobial peptide 2 [Astyanax mexicanus]|uniref:liver-expressed antimicrobial peptide 2 n=1 Tax=Astyanax mexicanus TaxID=7994 RepID=UPI0020CB0C3F|nr:liver-expressed antimicrobial peptide 2 [Astyanax mexicanus]